MFNATGTTNLPIQTLISFGEMVRSQTKALGLDLTGVSRAVGLRRTGLLRILRDRKEPYAGFEQVLRLLNDAAAEHSKYGRVSRVWLTQRFAELKAGQH